MSEPKRIRIVGDGTVGGTRILDPAGKDITRELCVRKITITHEARGLPVAVLECLEPEIDVTVLDDVAVEYVAGRSPSNT